MQKHKKVDDILKALDEEEERRLMRNASELEREEKAERENGIQQFLSTGFIKEKMPQNKYFADFVQ